MVVICLTFALHMLIHLNSAPTNFGEQHPISVEEEVEKVRIHGFPKVI